MIKGIIYGIVGAVIYDKVIKDRLRIYRWKCPDPICGFKGLANSQAALDKMILSHREDHI